MATTYGFSTNDTIKHIVEYLKYSLDSTFEIFVEPKINGDKLHIAILRKNAGVYILQVKAYHLDSYHVEDVWVEKSTLKKYQSPIQQMINFKNNFYYYHIPNIYKKLIHNEKYFGIVRCGLFFEKATTTQAYTVLKNDTHYTKYVDIFGYNCIDRGQIINVILKRLAFVKTESLFTDEMYESIKKSFLNKPLRKSKQKINLPEKSRKIINNTKQNGKFQSTSPEVLYTTMIYKATHLPKKVLILTYSMTLVSYIRNLVPACHYHRITVLHVHQFLAAQLNNINSINSVDSAQIWDDLISSQRYLQKYDSIIFSEIDKYNLEWQKNIKKVFLKENGSIYIFQQKYPEEKIKTIISGKWTSIDLNNTNRQIDYIYKENQLIDVHDIQNYLKSIHVSWKDSVILSSQKSYLRFIEDQLRIKYNIGCETSFATTLEWESIKRKCPSKSFGLEIQNLERNKKFHFGNELNCIQLNTVKSHVSFYKKVIILIVTDKDDISMFHRIIKNNDKFPTNILLFFLGRLKWQDFIDRYK